MTSKHDQHWLEKIHELGRLPAADMPGRLQARHLRHGWIQLVQGKHLMRIELTDEGRAAAGIESLDESALWRDWAMKIGLKLNCLASGFPGDNQHIDKALDNLVAIATSASKAVVDWDADDDNVLFIEAMDELRVELAPWRKSRAARAEWLRTHRQESPQPAEAGA